ncbi:HEAT repeat domain-containing protein [Polyangium aurulentum]|uniref:HEAT repeat domain-containing protein n=1 Tax=Polyangium aurulentum TaxID=2567896 RepID=UPI00146AABEB|nr:HEAT repeat domain-containing protein [Polyangium aurulentum]UQA61334.1 HEAT repeat domain-containing protein [Polyangium aurulentum]
MPKDTLKDLDRDAERLLFVGAAVARSDADLLAQRDKLAPFCAKVPAIGKVVEQIDALARSNGKAAAVELLGFAALMAQVRGAQAVLAAPKESGGLAPLPPAQRLGTPLSPSELGALVGALTGDTEIRYRAGLIRDYAARGVARDLRILPLALPALSDKAVSDAVEEALLPALGRAIVPDLVASLDIPQGKPSDARKLGVIAKILGEESKDLLREAVDKGSAEVRAAAITALAKVDPAGVEPLALELAQRDRSIEVRKMALAALGAGQTDEALAVLLAAYETSSDLRPHASTGLERIRHPQAGARLVSMLEGALSALGPLKIRRASTRDEKDAAAKAQKAREELVALVAALFELVAKRGGPGAVEVALDAYRNHKAREVRPFALQALLTLGHEQTFDEISRSILDAPRELQDELLFALFRLEPSRAFTRLSTFFNPFSLSRVGGTAFAIRIVEHIETHHVAGDGEPKGDDGAEASGERASFFEREPRWIGLLIDLLYDEDMQERAIRLLARAEAPQALDALLKLASRIGQVHDPAMLARLLRNRSDTRAAPAVAELLDAIEGSTDLASTFEYLVEADDPATAPALRRWIEGLQKKRGKRYAAALVKKAEDALRFLERDRASTSV